MSLVPLAPIGDARERVVDQRTFAEQRAALALLEDTLHARRREVQAGWGPKHVERVHGKGKLTARERLDALKDAETPHFEVGTFVNYGETFGEEVGSRAEAIARCEEPRGRGRGRHC